MEKDYMKLKNSKLLTKDMNRELNLHIAKRLPSGSKRLGDKNLKEI